MFEIREMTQKDIPSVAAIERECFSQPWSEGSLSSEILKENALMLVACSGGAVIGWGGLEHLLGEGSITNVAVSKTARRKGAARRLMLEIIKRAEVLCIESITLEVRESNIGAISLYKGLGFEELGKRPGFYDYPTEDALMMKLKATPHRNCVWQALANYSADEPETTGNPWWIAEDFGKI